MNLENHVVSFELCKEAVEEMQHIVQGYFKNILDDAPCPNFTKNLSLTNNDK